MDDTVVAWPVKGGRLADAPVKITLACDHGLWVAVQGLQVQLGSIEAYNRLVEVAALLRAKIERGEGKLQNPKYAAAPEIRRPTYPI